MKLIEQSFKYGIYPKAPDQLKVEQMTMRDQFAIGALQGIIACFRDHTGHDTTEKRVKKAYEYADMMMKERAK